MACLGTSFRGASISSEAPPLAKKMPAVWNRGLRMCVFALTDGAAPSRRCAPQPNAFRAGPSDHQWKRSVRVWPLRGSNRAALLDQ